MKHRPSRFPWFACAIVLRSVVLLPGVSVLAHGPQFSWPVASAQQPPTAPLVFDGITVVDVETGRLLASQRVVIVGNRVREVGNTSAVALPAGAHVVDARGKYLIPGLWDMHAHNMTDVPERYATYLASGVTGVRDMVTLVPLDALHEWRRQVASGEQAGPRVVATGPYLTDEGEPLPGGGETAADSAGPSGWPPQIGATTPDQARRAVNWFKAAGADFVKVRGDFSPEVYFAIAAEARRLHIPFAGHLPAAVTMAEASDSGQHSLEHANLYPGPCWEPVPTGNDECATLIARLVRNGTWLTPTLVWSADYAHNFRADSATAAAPDTAMVKAPDYAGHTPGGASSMDVTDWLWFVHRILPFHPLLLAGADAQLGHTRVVDGLRQYTDSERVAKIHQELALFVEAGLTPLEALQTATLNSAKYLGATDSLGTIAPNRLADLVVLDADPLADVRNTSKISAVVANGRYFDRAALNALLVAAKEWTD